MNTPAMRQFQEIKAKYPDAILFFRMGDFYEMFGDDAVEASAILDIALTKRQNKIPMCGIPYHATENYISRLISANRKVVICEQIKDTTGNSKLLQREVVRVLSPGTVVEENLLKGFSNNYFCVIYFEENSVFLGFADVSTSDLYYCHYSKDNYLKALGVIAKFSPSEIILCQHQKEKFREFLTEPPCLLSYINTNLISFDGETESKFYRLKNIIRFVLDENFKNHSFEFKSPVIIDDKEYLEIDEQTARNLDLVENQISRDKQFSLFSVLNHCFTGIGKRILVNRILFPFRNRLMIEDTWDKIEKLQTDKKTRKALAEFLSSFADTERILNRFRAGRALPRDFRTIRKNIDIASSIHNLLNEKQYGFIFPESELSQLDSYIAERLSEGELPAILGSGGEFIRKGFNEALDRAREARTKGKDWILDLEEKEKKKTGLNTLKIRYNKVVGYFVEISRAQAKSVPANYIKKQTLVTSERFSFSELDEIERTILEADDIILEIEKIEFENMLNKCLEFFHTLLNLSKQVGELDFILSLCICNDKYSWIKPEICEDGSLSLQDARHPVVEAYLPPGERFVPNTLELNRYDASIAILTGPNMAGKSTFMRQVAICQILFQMGSFIPAKKAKLALVDKVFTRIGSGDNLTSGESTFFLEMKETAYILKNKTKDSLILFDEIGRGTSTYDGMSLAWAIIEYLNHNSEPGDKTKTLFATHYHELTELERETGIFNLYMDVVEKEDTIIFMRKVRKGRARKSFGIYVARLAGVPVSAIQRAKEILEGLESRKKTIQFKSNEPTLFNMDAIKQEAEEDTLKQEILSLEIEKMTPLEAISVLNRLQQDLLKKKGN
ncbi:MAG: DNA mismatch repair protein MutS [Leptospiraceae bacterium]|nr:DNA mismatch repair protein MutS [Leptospiraceae bacterium]